MLLGLADQVRAGCVDHGALEGVITAYATARHDVSGESCTAVEQLHALLDADQRGGLRRRARGARIHDVRRAMLSAERLDELALKLHP